MERCQRQRSRADRQRYERLDVEGVHGAIYAGLERLTDRIIGKEWQRDDGAALRIDSCLIDANWGQSTDVVYQFCRQSQHAKTLTPSHGRYVGASSVPFSEYRRRPGERAGLNWRVPSVTGKRTIRHVVFDTNYWKSFIRARLAVPMGDPGCLSLFGRKAVRHRLLGEHLTSEYCIQTEGRGRTVDEWKVRANGGDNHWLDCLVGAAVGASIEGAVLVRNASRAQAPDGQFLGDAEEGEGTAWSLGAQLYLTDARRRGRRACSRLFTDG